MEVVGTTWCLDTVDIPRQQAKADTNVEQLERETIFPRIRSHGGRGEESRRADRTYYTTTTGSLKASILLAWSVIARLPPNRRRHPPVLFGSFMGPISVILPERICPYIRHIYHRAAQ